MSTLTAPRIIPGVKPIIKPVHTFALLLNQFRDLIAMLEHRYNTYGTIAARFFEFKEGERGEVLFFGPEYNRLILSDNHLFYNPGVTIDDPDARIFGLGLLFENGDIHQEHRRLMMPAFHKRTVETYCDTMVTAIDEFLNRWQIGTQRDINHDMHQLTMHIVTKVLFGIDVRDRSETLGDLIVAALNASTDPLTFLIPVNQRGFPLYNMIQTFKKLIARIRELITEKRLHPDSQNDALSILLHATDEAGGKLSDDELIGQANLLFVAGHETSANALVYTLLLLSQHPNIMANLLDELDGVLGGAVPTVEQLGKLPLLEAVVKENMRLFPPVAMLTKIAQDTFAVDGYEFPQYTAVSMSQYITQRMPEIYAEPRRFMPQRWETMQPTAYEYFPFGAGSRMCIGAGFAMMEIKLVLAMILQRYRLALVPNTRLKRKHTVTFGIDGQMPMVIHKQDKAFDKSKAAFSGSVRQMVDWV